MLYGHFKQLEQRMEIKVKRMKRVTQPPAKRSLIVTLREREREKTQQEHLLEEQRLNMVEDHIFNRDQQKHFLLISPSVSFKILSKTTSRTKFTMS